ncbi:MAG TPA: hypothetical protein VFE78_05190 [Gemmataceae bacterium]|jgi:hypothetical protein|nr:hypothetical protein [Gemmataceae bacterium]
MSRGLRLTGVIHGKTITLDEGTTFVADGTPVIIHLTLDPEEARRRLLQPREDMTPEEVADLEECLSEFHERPIKLPPPEPR